MKNTEHETELIKKAQNGESVAFTSLMRLHDKQVLQVAFSMVGNHDDAQDVFQETFINAYKHIGSFQFKSSFGTWITRITINCSINHRRKNKWRSLFSTTDVQDLDIMAKETDNHHKMVDTETKDLVITAMKKLPNQQRAVFSLKYLHDYKIIEIAEMLNVAEGTVKTALFRSTQKMRKVLKPYYAETL